MNDQEIDSHTYSRFTEVNRLQNIKKDGLRSLVPPPHTRVTIALYREFRYEKVMMMRMVNDYGCISLLVIPRLGT